MMETQSRPLCIFHGNCADGFTSAWVVNQFFKGSVDFHPGFYGQEPPDVTGRDVIIVDFSFKRDVLMAMAEKACSILILDHHKTAQEDLTGFLEPEIIHGLHIGYEAARRWANEMRDEVDPIRCIFDMKRSGAGLTWDYFFPDQARPRLVDIVEDRDLWRFSYPSTRAAHAVIFSYTYTFENWDHLAKRAETEIELLVVEGLGIERKHCKDIYEFISVAARVMEIAGYIVPVLNAPYFWASDAGNIMSKDQPFAACYGDQPDGRHFSLRSSPGGISVADIAKQFGGGGHNGAAGFRVGFDHPLARA